jgi:gas vesicle protein
MSTSTKVALGVFGALSAGVIIGLLIAPEKGTEMRQRIKKTAGDWASQLGNVFSHAEEEVEQLKQKATRTAKAATE